MSRKIIGVTVGSPLPKSNLSQTDPTKGDYVKGRDAYALKDATIRFDAKQKLTEAQKEQARENIGAIGDIQPAVNAALEQAKASGEFDGKPGEKGDPGESGITAPVSGFFTLSVDADGNLWAYSEDGNAPNLEYDSETGNLYVVCEQG